MAISQDELNKIMLFVDKRIQTALNSVRYAYFGEVKSCDGYYVDVEIYNETTTKPIKKVPIFQSKWHHPIVQNGDTGVLINVGVNIATMLLGNKKLVGTDHIPFYVFLPLAKRTDLATAKADKATFTSAEQKTKIEKSDDGIKIETMGEYSLDATKAIELKTKDGVKIDATKAVEITTKDGVKMDATKDVAISAKSNITCEATQGVTLKGTKEVVIEGMQTSVKSQTPLEIGTSAGTVGDVIQELLNQLQTAFTTPAAPGAPICPAWAGLSALVMTKLKMVLK